MPLSIFPSKIFKKSEKINLNHIFNTLDEGIILINNNNLITLSNPKAKEYLGLPLHKNENLFKETNDPEVTSLLNDISSKNSDFDWKEFNLKNKFYKISLSIHPQDKLIVLVDITDEIKYQNYKSELISNISHELKTPLSMIMGYAETLIGEKETPKETSDKFLKKIF